MVCASWINTMFIRYHLPKLKVYYKLSNGTLLNCLLARLCLSYLQLFCGISKLCKDKYFNPLSATGATLHKVYMLNEIYGIEWVNGLIHLVNILAIVRLQDVNGDSMYSCFTWILSIIQSISTSTFKQHILLNPNVSSLSCHMFITISLHLYMCNLNAF